MIYGGRGDITDEKSCGCLETSGANSDVVKVIEVVRNDFWLTIQEIVEELNLNRDTERLNLITDLDVKKFVPQWYQKVPLARRKEIFSGRSAKLLEESILLGKK